MSARTLGHDRNEAWHDEDRIGELPTEVGVLMIVAGIGGILLPGPIGTPFLLVGMVALWPCAFERVERFVRKRIPRLHRLGMYQVKRYLADMERRYPQPRPGDGASLR
jgi:hypothetical protein